MGSSLYRGDVGVKIGSHGSFGTFKTLGAFADGLCRDDAPDRNIFADAP
jgi:hypothetical protein